MCQGCWRLDAIPKVYARLRQPRENQLPGAVSIWRPPGGHDNNVPATAREREPLLNQPSAPADREDICGAGQRGSWEERRDEDRRRGGIFLCVWRNKYYPICFNNMALGAYQEWQQRDHCLSLPGWFLFPSISQYLCLQSALKPFVFTHSGFSVLGRDSTIIPATASPINSQTQ